MHKYAIDVHGRKYIMYLYELEQQEVIRAYLTCFPASANKSQAPIAQSE